MKFLKYFLLLWVIFARLDPDPDSVYGSESTDPIESGSNWDPDPQPWFPSQLGPSPCLPPSTRVVGILPVSLAPGVSNSRNIELSNWFKKQLEKLLLPTCP